MQRKKGKLIKLKVCELVKDFNLYPRGKVDTVHVRDLKRLVEDGVELPPLVIDDPSLRIVDGWHRSTVYEQLYGPEYEIECLAKHYGSEAELFEDAMRYAEQCVAHLDTFDRTRCIVIGERLGLSVEQIAGALRMTVDAVGELKNERVGTMRVDSQRVPLPLKRTIKHMAGRTLNQEQVEANEKLSGMQQVFYANQLIMLIETGMLKMDDDNLMGRLQHLGKLIRGLTIKV